MILDAYGVRHYGEMWVAVDIQPCTIDSQA